MSEAPERIIYGRTMPAIYISHDEVPAWEKDATRYIRADIYEQQQKRIAELEAQVAKMFGELNYAELRIQDLRARNGR